MKPIFRVIVAGGRDFDDFDYLVDRLDHYLSKKLETHEVIIVCGEARGADTHGKRYAWLRGLKVDSFKPDWDLHGKRAGFIRNAEMINVANAAVIFWDGTSKGSKHTIDLALKKKLSVRVVRY